MCGISGYLSNNNFSNNKLILTKINLEIAHRGPDSSGQEIIEDSKVGLAMRRLSIQDTSINGSQPMISKNKKYIIIFNGEIYNFIDLKQELNISTKSGTDTEVLLEMIALIGLEKTLLKINGMFAFCLYDFENKKMYLARDALGVKPLYYGIKKNELWFCSELVNTFTKLFDNEIDNGKIQFFLRNAYTRNDSIYKNIKKVEAGSFIVFDLNQVNNYKKFNYWSLENKFLNQKASNDDIQNFEKIFENSIKQRLISDRKVGVFLSGGIDSTLVTYYANKLAKSKLNTYTLAFNEKEFDESKKATLLSNYLGTNHKNFYFDENKLINLIDKMPSIYAEPFADSSQLPTYLLSEYVSKEVKVVLTGDGADELFFGYDYYSKIYKYKNILRFLSSNHILNRLILNFINNKNVRKIISDKRFEQIIKILLSSLNRSEIENIKSRNNINTFTKELLIVNSLSDLNVDHFFKKLSINQNLSLQDLLSYLEGDILVKVDRSSMSNSIEFRSPFADDQNIINFAINLDDDYKISKVNSKILLKKLLFSKIPKKFFDEKKRGFSIPLNKWMNTILKENIDDLSSKEFLKKQGIFNHKNIQNLILLSKKGNNWYDQILWSYFMFQKWYYKKFYS
tara:strand:+ start:518 stop:2389 length:1872 start_codon:yes stop_codon:yes gene_type:complete